MLKRNFSIFCLLSLTILLPASAFAVGSGGFENASFSPKSLAEGVAVVAQPDEPAAISYNPAGIVDLPGMQIQTNTAFISIFNRHADGSGSTYGPGSVIPVPTAYLTINPGNSFNLNDRLAFGVGVDSPFGLSTHYDSNHRIARYAGHANWLKMYAVKPVAAIRLTDIFSIAAGPMYYRIFDMGQVAQYANTAAVPGAADGQFRANLKGHGWGWQMGALLDLHKKHHLGFYLRSPVSMHTSGLVKVERALVGGNFETGVKLDFDLPLNMTVGYAWDATERTTIELDYGFTRWRAFKDFHASMDPVNAVDDAILAATGFSNRDYGNSHAVHLGGNHRLKALKEKLTLRAGSTFFWTPLHEVNFTPAVPDSNSFAIGTGLSYEMFEHSTIDLAYYIRYWFEREIDNTFTEAIGGSVDGRYRSFAQELFLGYTYKFDELFKRFKKKTPTDMSDVRIEAGKK